MTKTEKMNLIRLKSKLYHAYVKLEQDTIDYDCTWPKSIIRELKECVELISKLKV